MFIYFQMAWLSIVAFFMISSLRIKVKICCGEVIPRSAAAAIAAAAAARGQVAGDFQKSQ
jgi:hypothetical protein